MIATRTPSRDTAIKHAGADLAQLLAAARAAWVFPDRPPAVSTWSCADCGTNTHAASVGDPLRCLRCARPDPRYAWRATPFGRIRKVLPKVAARWPEESHDG